MMEGLGGDADDEESFQWIFAHFLQFCVGRIGADAFANVERGLDDRAGEVRSAAGNSTTAMFHHLPPGRLDTAIDTRLDTMDADGEHEMDIDESPSPVTAVAHGNGQHHTHHEAYSSSDAEADGDFDDDDQQAVRTAAAAGYPNGGPNGGPVPYGVPAQRIDFGTVDPALYGLRRSVRPAFALKSLSTTHTNACSSCAVVRSDRGIRGW